MQNGSAGAQARALGDLQLESQQVAQSQRRIAEQAERLDREGGGTADARRRLADEKERLADRVDALQQSAQGMPGGRRGRRDLAAQRAGQRMRSGAAALRDAAPEADGEPRSSSLPTDWTASRARWRAASR